MRHNEKQGQHNYDHDRKGMVQSQFHFRFRDTQTGKSEFGKKFGGAGGGGTEEHTALVEGFDSIYYIFFIGN